MVLLLLLPFLAISTLLLPAATANNALFTEPLQVLFGGSSLTEGSLSLYLGRDCSLVLYDYDVPVANFNTTVPTQQCVLLVDVYGELHLLPENSSAPIGTIGAKSMYGRYMMLLHDAKLGIYGPALWSNGILSGLSPRHDQKEVSLADKVYFLYSGQKVYGSVNGDVVVAEHGSFSAVIRPDCSLAVMKEERIVWQTWPTSRTPGTCELELKTNGELVLRDGSGGDPIWSSGSSSAEGLYVGVLRCNGEIVIYGLKAWLYAGAGEARRRMIA